MNPDLSRRAEWLIFPLLLGLGFYIAWEYHPAPGALIIVGTIWAAWEKLNRERNP